MADQTPDTPVNPSETPRPNATIKLKKLEPEPSVTDGNPVSAADSIPVAQPVPGDAVPADSAEAPVITPAPAASAVPGIKQTIRLRPPSPAPSAAPVPGIKQTIRLRPPSASSSADASEVKPAIKIVPKAAEAPTGIPTAKPVDSASNDDALKQTISLVKPESSTPTVQLEKPEAGAPPTIPLQKKESAPPTIQLQKKESPSSAPTIQLKKPDSTSPTIQLKKPEPASSEAAPAKKVGDAPPARKLTLKLKNQPAPQKELPKNLIPGLNIPTTPPPINKEEKKDETGEPPVAAPVETPTPVPEAVPETDGKKKKGKLPKVKKAPAPPSSADEPNWFFLTLSCLTLVAVCFIAYLLFAQYMNLYKGMEIPIPGFLMPK